MYDITEEIRNQKRIEEYGWWIENAPGNRRRVIEDVVVKLVNELKYNKRFIYNAEKFDKYLKQNKINDLYDEGRFNRFIDRLLEDVNKRLMYDGRINVGSIKLLKKVIDKEAQSKAPADTCCETKGGEDFKIYNFTKNDMDDVEVKFNDFIVLDFVDIVISGLWVEIIGRKLDSKLPNYVYGNRVNHSRSQSFFKMYYQQYSQFRDGAFREISTSVESGKKSLALNIDFTKSFYNVSVSYLEKKVNKMLNFEKCVINEYIFNLIDEYNSIIGNEKEGLGIPIGFLPSNILINIYLQSFDEIIKNSFESIQFYGRYVDDTSLVLSASEPLDENKIIDKINLIEKEFKEQIEKNSVDKGELSKMKLINKSKTLIFSFDSNLDKNYLNKYKEMTTMVSSDFYKLISIKDIGHEVSKAYEINNVTKGGDIVKIQKNKIHLAKIIGSTFSSVQNRLNSRNEFNISDTRSLLNNFKSFATDSFFLELYDYWYMLIFLEINYSEQKTEYQDTLIYKRIDKMKKKIEEKENMRDLYEFLDAYSKKISNIFNDNSFVIDLIVEPKFKNEFYYTIQKNRLSSYEIILHAIQKSLYANQGESELQGLLKETINSYTEDRDGYVKESLKLFSNSLDNKGKEVLDLDKVNYGVIGDGFNYVDLEKKGKIKIAQSNLSEGQKRFDSFIFNTSEVDFHSDIVNALNKAQSTKSDILTFPEHSILIDDLPLLINYVRKTKITIIFGLYYFCLNGVVYNKTAVVTPFTWEYKNIGSESEEGTYKIQDVNIMLKDKVYPSPAECDKFSKSNCGRIDCVSGCNKNWSINRENVGENAGLSFKLNGYVHTVLNCFELTDIQSRANLQVLETDFLHVVAHNRDVDYFDDIGRSISRDLKIAVSTTNYSEYGGTQVYIPFKEKYKRYVSYHKGGEDFYVTTSTVDMLKIRRSRIDNTAKEYKQNSGRIYHKNNGL